jgi:hypothetical protein
LRIGWHQDLLHLCRLSQEQWPAELANAEVLKGLKTRSFNAKLEACGKKWFDNL